MRKKLKRNILLRRVLCMFLAFLMISSVFTLQIIDNMKEASASKNAKETQTTDLPNMTVTSLAEIYGDQTRAKEDIETLQDAGLLDKNGKLVDLNICANGKRVELSTLVNSIVNGETVGNITVNGNDATPEQILKISQVSSAIEIAELLDEEIDFTDDHVKNLETLLTGIQNGTIDLGRTLKTGALHLNPQKFKEILSKNPGDANGLPTLDGAGTAAGMLNVSSDGKSYIGPYINGSEYEAEHAFLFPEDVENKEYYYVDSNTSNVTGIASPDTVSIAVEDTVTTAINQESHVGYLLWEINPNFSVKLSVPEGMDASQIGNIGYNYQFFSAMDFADWTEKSHEEGKYRWYEKHYGHASPVCSGGFSGNNVADGSTTNASYWATTGCYNHSSVGNEWVGKRGVLICFKDLTGNATFENGAKTVYARAYCEIPNKTMDNIYTTDESFVAQYGSYTSLHAETTVPISYINVPAGTYRSGEYVPIVVDFGDQIDNRQRFVKTDENTKLIVNGTECELLDEPGIYSSYLCFLYKVKDVDSGALVVESISGLKTKDGEDITIVDGPVKLTEDGKINMTFGAEQGVIIAADVVYDRIDWDNTKFGVDENHLTPAVTVVLPLKNVDDDLKTSIANASKECGLNNGLGINMTVPVYGEINVKYYMTNMYFGNNSKKYPVYILTEGEDETPVALIGHFATEPNLKKYVRLDTLYLYMNRSGVVDSSTIPALSEADTDAFGLPYFNGPVARALGGRVYQYYVAPAVYVDKTKFIERTAPYELAEGGFIRLTNPEDPDFMYVYPGDPEHPENQYDLELLATEDLYQAQIRGGAIYMDEVPDIRYKALYSSRKDFESKNDFTVEEDSLIIWWWKAIMPYVLQDGVLAFTSIKESTVHEGFIEKCTLGFRAVNGGFSYIVAFPKQIFVCEGLEPFLAIPRSSQIRETQTELDTTIFFSTNIPKKNSITTVFNAKLYKIDENQIGNGVPDGAVPIEVANWGEFSGYITNISVPGRALSEAGAYAVTISTEFNDGTVTTPYSATAYIKVKNAPAEITLNKLEAYGVTKDNIPAIGYTLIAAENAEVKYTVQPTGEAVSEMTAVSGGIIPFAPDDFDGLKKAYIISVYARNSEEDAWSTDAILLTVYNTNPLKLILADVPFGELGGTTGGTGTEAGSSIVLDNTGRILVRLADSGDGSGYQVLYPDTDFDTLRHDLNLQKVISANYGSGAWGILSDKLKWAAKDYNGELSDDVTLNYQQGGYYSDIRNYTYTSYIPTSDFLIVGTNNVSEDAPVTITATHAATGLQTSVNVTVNTLQNKLYLFRFNPKTETEVIYTNGDGVERRIRTDAKGELVVYEPAGIKGDVVTMSVVDGETYVGTILNRNLLSGEKNVVKMQIYPCNNLTLKPISSQTLTFYKPDGSTYTGEVILRGGVYLGNEYCPDAGIRTSKDGDLILREDAVVTVTNGKTTVWFDPSQFVSINNNNNLTDGLKYVFEYRFENTYQPGYIIVDTRVNDSTASVVTLQSIRGNAQTPQIISQEYQQYRNDGAKNTYTRNVIDSTENIGISPNFNKAELYTDVALLGENVVVGDDVNGKKGYSTYAGADVLKFAFYTTDGKKLTGQTDFSGNNIQATQIMNLSQLNDATYFIFPFATVPMLRSTYVMTDANMTADGITNEGNNPTSTARIKAVFTRGSVSIGNINMPFGVTNVSHLPDLSNKDDGAKEIGIEVRDNLKETVDIGSIFQSINVNDMIRKGFVFLSDLTGAGADSPINLMILPTQDPATFRIIAFIGANQRPSEDEDGVSVNFNSEDLAEDMQKYMEEMDKDDDDDDDDNGGEGSMEFNFYGTIILEAHAGIADGKWDIAFRGGNVGANVKGKYEWGQTFFCGPYPAFISFEVGFHVDLEVAFGNKGSARAMLLDAALGVSIEAFAGLGFDLSIVAIQLGIYGQIGADVNFLMLAPSDQAVSTGTKLTISGEIGIKLKVKLLFISYTETFASTGFNWTKKWNKYDQIKDYWNSQGYGQLFGRTKSGRAYQMMLFADGSAMVAIDGGPEMESRDYLELEERVWTSGMRLRKASGPITDVQSNAYPYSHPVFTDDGELFLYVSDNDNANGMDSVTSFAVKNGDGYENMGRIDTSENNVLADLDIVASGTKDSAFAAWVKQVETPKKEKSDAVSGDYIGMMFNATEIYASSYNGTEWTTTRLTDNSIADMSPSVASYGNNAIIAWRSMNTSNSIPETVKFNGKIYNEGNHSFASEGDSLNLPKFDLSGYTNNKLSFKVKCDYAEDWGIHSLGHLTAQYSEDGTNWINISGATDLSYSGWDGAWHDVSVELPAKNIQIRFITSKFWMDNYNTVYIDNISMTADPYTINHDLTSIFNVENNVNYSIYNGTEWTTAKIAYNGSIGTINAIDSAMLADGTAIITYTVRTGEDVTTTETFYTVVGPNGNIITTGRLTNDNYTDTNAQAIAVNEGVGYFVLGWYSEHDAGKGNNYDGKAVVDHDIRLARINANGSYDIDFPESVGIGSAGITSDFHFSAPVCNDDLTNVSIVWSQRKVSDEAEDAGKYEINAIRFFRTESLNGFTAPTNICTTNKNYTIDHFDVYTDDEGAIHAIILGSDYDSIKGIEVYDSIDLDAAAGNAVSNNSDAPSNLDILDGEAISSLKLAKGTFPEIAADVTADINIREVIPGFSMPVQFTVTNKGTDILTSITVTISGKSKDFNVNLLPNEYATIMMTYDVPEGAVSDIDYNVTSSNMELGSGTFILNRPDVGISGMKIIREENGERDIQIVLSNSSQIPLAESGKTVKLAIYKDPFFESMIGEELTIPASSYADIDNGIFKAIQTINVSNLFTGTEIPAAGLTVYARAWVEDTVESNIYNNDSFLTFSGLLARNNKAKLSTNTLLEINDGSYTVYADIRNNSMQEVNAGIPVVVLLDSNGNIVASKNLQDTELVMSKELHCDNLTMTFTADEIEGTPVEASIRFLHKVSFNVNGGSGNFAEVTTDIYGHITLPENEPTAPQSNPSVFFRGWYTAQIGGELVTEETFFNDKTTIYARYTPHTHVFEYVVSDSGDIVTATCVSTVNDDCPLEDNNRIATLTISVPERTATGYGMPDAIITGTKEAFGTIEVKYYLANEAGTDKEGDALAKVPLMAGKYWAEITLGEGENTATIHVVYEIPVIEGLAPSSEATIPNFVRTNDPSVMMSNIGPVDRVSALAWIYDNLDMLRQDRYTDKFIVMEKRFITRPEDLPEDIEWPYQDDVEYVICYHMTEYESNSETIPIDDIINHIESGDAKVYIPSGTVQVTAEANFKTISSRDELNSFDQCNAREALLWIVANRNEISMGIFMLSMRDEDDCSFINFNHGRAEIMNSNLNYVFDMSEWEEMPIFVLDSGSGVLSPNLTYTVSYNVNGGNGNVSGGGKYYVKSKIVILSGDGLSKTNLVFDGWNTKADGTGEAYKPGEIIEVMGNMILYAKWKHVHNWTISYDEDTHVYTATCDVPGCPHSTLTLQPTEVDKMYDGENAKPYTCSIQWTEENDLPMPDITFYKNGEEVSEAKNVGTYTALVSLNGYENNVGEFHITKRPVVVIADDQEKHEGQKDPELTVSYDAVSADLIFSNDAIYPWIVVTEEDRVYVQSGNAEMGDTTSTLTLTVTLAEEGTIYFDYKYGTEGNWDWCYFRVDGNEIFRESYVCDWTTYSCPLSAGTHTITWAYSKDGGSDLNGDFFAIDNVTIKSSGAVTQSDIPTDSSVLFDCLIADLRFNNDATYPWIEVTEDNRVFVKSGNAGFDDSRSTLKLSVTLTEIGTLSFDYKYGTENYCDGCYFFVDNNKMFEEYDVKDWTTYSCDLSAGNHTLTWYYKKDSGTDENGDFFAIDNIVLTTDGTVTQPDPMLEIMAFSRAINGYQGGIVEGEKLNYTISREEGEKEGTYIITVTMKDNPNYDVMEVRTGTFTILEWLGEPQTIDADDITATYGDTGLNINAEVTIGDGTLSYEVISGDAVTVDSNGNITIVKVGTAVIAITASQTDNYALTQKNITITIDPKDMTVSADDVTATVNGQSYGITVSVTEPATGYTIKYGTTEGMYNLNTCPKLTEEGTLTVYYQVTADNYVTYTGSATITLVAHEHNLNYTVGTGENANTIIATCLNEDCPYANNTATLTISAPNGNIIYDGTIHAAIIIDENGIKGDAIILYSLKGSDGTPTENAPVNVGTYRASITLGTGDNSATAYVEFEIKNATLTNVSVAQNGTLTYNGNAQTPQVTTSAISVNNQPVTFTYSNTENGEYGDMPTFTNAGTYTVYYKATAPNHEIATGSFNIIINKGSQNAPAAPTLDTATASMIKLTEVAGCEYSMDGINWQDSPIFNSLIKDTQYNFYQRLKETENLNASLSSVVATISTSSHDHDWSNFTGTGATITATCGNTDGGHSGELSATMTISAPSLTVYGGTGSAEATVVNNIPGIETPTIVYKKGDVVLTSAPVAAGTYTACITSNGADASVTYTISQKSVTLTALDKSKTYGETDPELTAIAQGLEGNDTLNYTLARREGNNVGEYVISITLGNNPNYNVTVTNGKFTIVKKSVTLTALDKSKTYGETDPELTATALGLIGNDTLDYTLARAEGNSVGEYVITITLGNNPNYNVTVTNGKFTIVKRSLTVTANNTEITYGDAPTNADVSFVGLANNDTRADLGGELKFAYTYAQFGNVGEYTITPSGYTSGNYEITFVEGKLTVNAKRVTVTIVNKTSVYGEARVSLEATTEEGAIVNGDKVYTLACDVNELSNAGTYDIVGTSINTNYNVTFANESKAYEVTKRSLTVTANNTEITYGDEPANADVSFAGFVNNDTRADLDGELKFAYTYRQFGNVGEYAITPSGYTSENYEITFVEGKLTVNAKRVTVTIVNKTSVYGEAQVVLTATDNGIVNNDKVYTLACDVNELSNVGTYDIVGTSINPNYNVTFANESKAYEVTKRHITITADDKTIKFGEDIPNLTFTLSEEVDENVLNELTEKLTLTCNADSSAPEKYAINISFNNGYTSETVLQNYEVTLENGNFYVLSKVLENNGVEVTFENTEEAFDYEISVEVDIVDTETEQSLDYDAIAQDYVSRREEISMVYSIKLLKTEIVNGVETFVEIQPNDISDGTVIVIKIQIPEKLIGRNFRILHIHTAEDIEYVDDANVEVKDGFAYVKVNRLSGFAFVNLKDNEEMNHKSFCMGWVLFIIELILIAYFIVYVILKKKSLLGLIGLIVSTIALLYGVVTICLHICIISIIGFILAILNCLGFLCLFLLDKLKKKKEHKEEKVQEVTKPQEEKALEENEEVIEEPQEEVEAEEQNQEVDEDDEEEIITDEQGYFFKLMYNKSFTAKAIQTSDEAKNYYQELKNYALSYKGVTSRVSWNYDSINRGRANLLKFSFKRKNLYVYFALNPDDYADSKYNLVKVDSKKYQSVPAMFGVKNDRNLKYAKELIDIVCGNEGLTLGSLKEENYILPYEDTKTLLDKGLIKMVKNPIQEKPKAKIKIRKKVSAEEVNNLITNEEVKEFIIEGAKAKRNGKKAIINILTLNQNFNDGDTVNVEALKAKGLIASNVGYVKVLASGSLEKKLNVELQDYSIEAAKMIVLTGGTVKRG